MTENRIIDADAHWRETDNDYISRLDGKFRGGDRVLFPRDNWDRSLGRMGKEVHDPELYLKDMDTEGIHQAVLYPTTGLRLSLVRQPDLARALARAWNDFVGTLGASHPRIRGVAMVSLDDVDTAVEELRRAVSTHDLVGLMVHSHGHGKNLGSREIWPLYQEAAKLDIPVVFHSAVMGAEGVDRWTNFLCAHTTGFALETLQACLGVLTSGVLDHCPDLRIGFFEAGCGWVPYWFDRMDEICEKRPEEVPLLKSLPGDYVRAGRVFFTFEPDEIMLSYCVERYGDDCFLFASDYPHWDCTFPEAVRTFMDRDDIDEASKTKLAYGNALRFYPRLQT